MFARIRISFALVVAVMGSLVFATPFAGPAEAAGNPDVSLAVSMPAETLHGDTTEVTLIASNPGGPDGFNLSYRVVLPAGVSYVSGGAGTPIEVADKPNPGETTLFFENVSDLLAGNDATLTLVVRHAVSGHHNSPLGVHDLPVDVRYHYTRDHQWRLRRTDQILSVRGVHRHMVSHRLRTDLSLGVGTGWLDQRFGRAGLFGD